MFWNWGIGPMIILWTGCGQWEEVRNNHVPYYLGLNQHEKLTCYFLRWKIMWLNQVWGFENNWTLLNVTYANPKRATFLLNFHFTFDCSNSCRLSKDGHWMLWISQYILSYVKLYSWNSLSYFMDEKPDA